MAITPAVLIATRGLMLGQTFNVNSVMTGVFNKVSNDPMVSNIEYLKSNGYSSSVSALPSFMTDAQSTIDNANARAQLILPSGAAGTRSFIGLFGSASSLGSASAEFAAAVAQYKNKSFGDLGVGANSYKSLLSNNISQTFPYAKSAAALNANGALLSKNLGNFGSAYDFRSPANFGARNLVENLNKQGLTSKIGINDALAAAGYSVEDLSTVPEPVLHSVLQNVKGNDLQHIVKMTGAKPYASLNSLADMTDAGKMLHPDVVKNLGIKAGAAGSVAGLGNKLNNLGAPMDLGKLQGIMASSEFKDFEHLDALKTPLPSSIASGLAAQLGTGSGLYGNPTMTDMLGSVSGAHTAPFKNIHDSFGKVRQTSAGSDLNAKLAQMKSAVQGGDSGQIAAAQAALNSSVSSFNNFTSSSTEMDSIVGKANSSIGTSAAQLSREASNMALAGKDFNSLPTPSTSITPILNFSSKLHTFGVDKMGVGYNDILDSVTADNLYGDALNSALLEGRNISRSQFVGKITSSVADQTATNQASAKSALSTAEQQVKQAAAAAKDGSPENAYALARAQGNLDARRRMAAGNPLA